MFSGSVPHFTLMMPIEDFLCLILSFEVASWRGMFFVFGPIHAVMPVFGIGVDFEDCELCAC